MITETITGKNSWHITPETTINIKYRSDRAFLVEIQDPNSKEMLIVGPNSETDRYFACIIHPNQKINIKTSGKYTIYMDIIKPHAEEHNGEILVDEDEEPDTLYDKLRQEMYGMMQNFAEKNDLESLDDEDYEEDDDDNPLSAYEIQVMKEDFLKENPSGENPPEQQSLDFSKKNEDSKVKETPKTEEKTE